MTDGRNRKPSVQTSTAQALHYVEAETGAVIPAIQPTATYARDENYEVRKPYWYRRDGSQTTTQAEAVIAELEGANESLLFSSGMSACTAVIEQLARISQSNGCIGPKNLRKFFCNKDLPGSWTGSDANTLYPRTVRI